MINLKFVLKRMKNINYGGFKESAKRVSKVNGKPWPLVLADCLICSAKYGSGYIDYETFAMYDMNAAERANVLTISKNNDLVKMLNDQSYAFYFEDKAVFNEKFAKFVKRDWLLLKEDNFSEFEKFIADKEKLIAKPLDLSCGKGIDIYYMKDHEPRQLFEQLLAQKAFLVEEVVEQSDEMKALFPGSVNTVRIVTILCGDKVNFAAGCLRMGRGKNVVDNFNHGGISGILDVKTGTVASDGYDKFRANYERHPETGTKIKGFKIPLWEEISAMIDEAARVVPQIRYVAWDIALDSEQGPLLIEGNSYPGQDLSQYPKLNLGTYGAMLAAMKE